ncbi:hypothetical protein CCAN2_2030080 [Capnocytophaga canimorsus]|nr:hypothetical protein CCAN2_2030080 [Capnocytophaga canimorsus]
MTITDKESFEGALGEWFEKVGGFSKRKKCQSIEKQTFYKHKKVTKCLSEF